MALPDDPFQHSLMAISALRRVAFALLALALLWAAISWAVGLP